MNSRGIHPLLAGVLGFAALVLLLPSFALAVRPDDSAGPLGGVPVSSGITSVRPDNRSGPLGVGIAATSSSATHQVGRPDDRSGPLGATPITSTSHTAAVSVPASVSNDSFQWSDAAVGAASMMVLFLLALGAVVLQRQHRGSAVAH